MRAHYSRVAAVLVTLAALGYFTFTSLRVNTTPTPTPAATVAKQDARRAIVISLDGLDVRYLRRADEFGLKIPTLRRLMREGVFAGVESVYPSVTYPDHTTIVTGALPARHGIINNQMFDDPSGPRRGRQFWFAEQVKADALWDAARRGGLKTGLVSWPVSTGAGDWNVPEIWKEGTRPSDSFPATLAEISKHARPSGLVEEIARAHPDIYRNVTRDEGDDMRARWAEYLIREKRPQLMLVHLFDLDHAEHDHGPFTPEAFRILEKIDGYVGRIIAAAESAGTLRDTAVFIVSDHGFRSVSKTIQPGVVLREAGLVSAQESGGDGAEAGEAVTSWRAFPYPGGGSCAIVLRDPNDREAATRARAALEQFNARSGGKLFRFVERDELRRLGAYPNAAFVLEAAPDYFFGDSVTGPAVVEGQRRGMHGYLPHPPDYRATFVATGLDVIKRGDLGDIPMTEVGPVIAGTLGVELRDAQSKTLALK